jgi:hypothetical protein
MAKLKAVPPNPVLPFTPITIDGRTYKMVFQHASLAKAEDELRARGHDVNLLGVYLKRTYSNVRVLFAASLLAYQPEMDFEEAQNLVTDKTIVEILVAVNDAWNKNTPDPEKSNPPVPEE